jgi:hypothetical protein
MVVQFVEWIRRHLLTGKQSLVPSLATTDKLLKFMKCSELDSSTHEIYTLYNLN